MMPEEEKGKLVKFNPEQMAISSNSKVDERENILAIINSKIQESDTPEEAAKWTLIRREAIAQNQGIAEVEKENTLARREQIANVSLRVSALVLGTALILLSHQWIGGFLAAAGVYAVAKDFVM